MQRLGTGEGWEGAIEYENQMQFSNGVVKGQTGPNPLRPRAAALGLPDDAAEPLELALARDLAGVELRALNRGSILSHNQPDKLRLHHAQRDNQNRGKVHANIHHQISTASARY